MENFNRIIEITNLLKNKIEELRTLDKDSNNTDYQLINDEISELKIELEDLVQIDTATSTYLLEKKDKNIETLKDLIDFDSLESEDFRKLARIQEMEEGFIKEIDSIMHESNQDYSNSSNNAVSNEDDKENNDDAIN